MVDPNPQGSPPHKFSVTCQVDPATEIRQLFFFFSFFGAVSGCSLVGNSKQPFGQVKAKAIQLYPSWQEAFADTQPRHQAGVSCTASTYHSSSQTAAAEQ